ncbi:hypothetical protein E2C01_060772 [Portunus trituberculatus]|uniref:Uncharacterized protein n=1 Tax=Portunus trituberculatus TaxID=210409 RepID=A0A5B7H6G5_PORTR|nr:hypothetical protein [Portunus trituberculatus]
MEVMKVVVVVVVLRPSPSRGKAAARRCGRRQQRVGVHQGVASNQHEELLSRLDLRYPRGNLRCEITGSPESKLEIALPNDTKCSECKLLSQWARVKKQLQ